MTFQARPIGFKPGRMKGLTPRLIASHYENNYGGALRRLNAIRGELAALYGSTDHLEFAAQAASAAERLGVQVGDAVVVGRMFGKVRSLESTDGGRIAAAGPSTAAILSGLPEVPASGEILRAAADEREARSMAEAAQSSAGEARDGRGHATMEELYGRIQSGAAKEIRVILKSDVAGSLGAIEHQLEKLQSDEVRLNVLLAAAGEVTESDILLASASDAIILGFTTTLTPGARRMAESEKVDVRLYEIIYELGDKVREMMADLLDPDLKETKTGAAEVRQPPCQHRIGEREHRDRARMVARRAVALGPRAPGGSCR